MSETVKLGQKVPEFELATYDPSTGKFGNYMFRKPAEVCPSRWKEEGDKTLLPSEELVGAVHETLAD